ncbi:hypothetical protein ACQEVF_58125 [Nonomuraea polychroma]|uniref:hypothetical protein n=1 Tax=Nonomuraea polychroma TaxID=46176 RepID=UPI003D89DA61
MADARGGSLEKDISTLLTLAGLARSTRESMGGFNVMPRSASTVQISWSVDDELDDALNIVQWEDSDNEHEMARYERRVITSMLQAIAGILVPQGYEATLDPGPPDDPILRLYVRVSRWT